jgi:hypothetical protein
MKRIYKHIIVTGLAMIGIMSWGVALAQDSAGEYKSEKELMSDVLDLNDPVLSIWPSINNLELESLSAAVKKLKEAYEADRTDADVRARNIESMVIDAIADVDVIKVRINAAKDAKDDAEKKRLESVKDDYELRRKYLERIGSVRDGERKLAESNIDYVKQLEDVLEKAETLDRKRKSGNEDEKLAAERELIRQSKELGERLSQVSDNLKKVNSEREKAFKDREKLLSYR